MAVGSALAVGRGVGEAMDGVDVGGAAATGDCATDVAAADCGREVVIGGRTVLQALNKSKYHHKQRIRYLPKL